MVIALARVSEDPDYEVNRIGRKKILPKVRELLVVEEVDLSREGESLISRRFSDTRQGWNQLPAGLLASFPCKLNTFRKRVKNVVTSKGIQVGIECK
jgi:hypothetical protein